MRDYYEATSNFKKGDKVECWDNKEGRMRPCIITDIRYNVKPISDEHPHPVLFDITFLGEGNVSYGHMPYEFFED